MQAPTINEFKNLIQTKGDSLISMYIPTVKSGNQTEQNHIRFHNVLREVENTLKEMGVREKDIDTKLGAIKQLTENHSYWEHQERGLAFFLENGQYREFSLPFSVEEHFHIAERFYIKPLLPLFQSNAHYFCLTITKSGGHLYRCSPYSIEEIEVPDAPEGMEDSTKYDQMEEHLQYRTGSHVGPDGTDSRMVHGQGVGTDEKQEKKRVEEYIKNLQKAVYQVINEESIPLVLVCLDEFQSMYRTTNTYKYLVDDFVRHNPDQLDRTDLLKQTYSLISPRVEEEKKNEWNRFQQFRDTAKATDTLKEAVTASYEGRIATLFIPLEEKRWGVFDPLTEKVELHDSMEPADQELMDITAANTILHGGKVYTIEDNEYPKETEIAALFWG